MSEQRVPYLVPREPTPRRRRQPTPRPIKLLTPAEVAAMLKLSRKTVYRLLQRGDIPSIKIGRKRIVQREWVMEYLDEHTSREW